MGWRLGDLTVIRVEGIIDDIIQEDEQGDHEEAHVKEDELLLAFVYYVMKTEDDHETVMEIGQLIIDMYENAPEATTRWYS